VSSSSALALFASSTELFVAALGASLLLLALFGRIRLTGLFVDGDTVSAVKLQLFIISLTVTFEYAMAIARTPTPSRLPPLDDTLLTLGAGSNALFAVQRLLARFTNLGL
jgi:hypothetical protein